MNVTKTTETSKVTEDDNDDKPIIEGIMLSDTCRAARGLAMTNTSTRQDAGQQAGATRARGALIAVSRPDEHQAAAEIVKHVGA